MERIVQMHADFYEKITKDPSISMELKKENITILDGFHQNLGLVKKYYETMYKLQDERIVLCGINPGRNGAGKTGIPFIDFRGASHVLSDVFNDDWERSAQFILSIIKEVGIEDFHKRVYMTNLSWFGFKKDGKKLNYYKLPHHLANAFTESFINEMDIVNPKVIIPLSKEVEKTLEHMVRTKKLNYPVAPRLPHPYYCSIGENTGKYKKEYLNAII
ncbi:uracil-DNA glycosylase family protein [Metabacillus idriensis]|uniref:uracil-DNA glycosylase family protein n=1 Tax=Metabacillus idriensis TaxID=324768 RepID=UPI003D2CCDB1